MITKNKFNLPVYHNTKTFVKNSIASINYYPHKHYMRYRKGNFTGIFLKYRYNEK